MRDNRGEWTALDVARETDVPLHDRLFLAIVALAETTVDIARMLAFRSDLYRSRQQLRELDDAQLRDIGLTRRQADAEAGRPFFED